MNKSEIQCNQAIAHSPKRAIFYEALKYKTLGALSLPAKFACQSSEATATNIRSAISWALTRLK